MRYVAIPAVALVFAFANTAHARESMGAIKYIQADSKTIVLIDSQLAEHTFQLADNVRVVKNGHDVNLTDLKSGETVKAIWQDRGGAHMVTELDFMSK
jgi:Cu/Ag efflux protein CusF